MSCHLSLFIALHVACGHVSLTTAPETKFSGSRSRDKLLQNKSANTVLDNKFSLHCVKTTLSNRVSFKLWHH